MPDVWLPVWAALTDQSLETRLRHYFWLAREAPALHQQRFEQLVAEAERRGKAEMVDRAKVWVAQNGLPPPLS